jgi:surface polysaccharide O-acyltransferase-like enzyme
MLIIFGCGIALVASIKTMNTLDARFWMNPGAANAWQVGLFKVTRLVGVLAVWSVVASMEEKTLESLALLSFFAFIVYVGHEPTLNIVRKLLYRFASPSGDWGVLLYYFLTVIITIFMTVLLGMMLNKYTPRLYDFITGARSHASGTVGWTR